LSDGFDRNVHCLLGLPFDAVDMAGAVRRIRDAVTRREPCLLSTPNLNFLVACLTDGAFRDSVIDSDLSIPDGMPIVWIAKLLRMPTRTRVTGSGLFESLRGGSAPPISVYFFGGTEGAAEAACERLNAHPSGLVCVGHVYPGFGSIEEMSSDKSIAEINASGAEFVVVSLGARKGLAWIARNRSRLSAPVISHLGAVVDFVSGRLRRAPIWIQRAGLEWLWRIKEDPGLWRRYAGDGLRLLQLLVTRVLPYRWFISWHSPTSKELQRTRLELLDDDAEIVIHLRGAWVLENLGPLRQCFSRSARGRKDVRVEMEDVTYVDSAFIGLLMLLHGDRKRQSSRLSVSKPNERVQRIFRYACAEFLLT
jgi:N-acetylglucosaminyldiphosphoundecaprenol N-acetyl-beta-D-mannosaminyltransferase